MKIARLHVVTESLVLVVDDDAAICDTVEDGLHLVGYRTLRASDGVQGFEMVRKHHPDLVILDVNMPKLDGFGTLQRMRDAGLTMPVILLTARHDRVDTVAGLKLGADDYVRKPFGLEELLLRVAAVLRRSAGADRELLTCGPLMMDTAEHAVRVGGAVVELSPTEYRLLEFLLRHMNRAVSKEQILDAVWGIDFDSSTTVVETFVSYIRKKIGPDAAAHLRTIRGVGFKMVEVA